MPHRTVLCISYRFPRKPYRLSIGLCCVIDLLRTEWTIEVVSAASDAYARPNVDVRHVPGSTSRRTIEEFLRAVRLEKFDDVLAWPDPYWPWIPPAVRRTRQVVDSASPDVILAFMMPVSTDFVGTRLKAQTGLPGVMGFHESPPCSEMHPRFPSRLHYTLAQWIVDDFVQNSGRSRYVSRHNRNRRAPPTSGRPPPSLNSGLLRSNVRPPVPRSTPPTNEASRH